MSDQPETHIDIGNADAIAELTPLIRRLDELGVTTDDAVRETVIQALAIAFGLGARTGISALGASLIQDGHRLTIHHHDNIDSELEEL